MKIACATAVSFLIATVALAQPTLALAQQVTFTCGITGSGDSGFDIYAINPGPDRKKCSATCTVTKRDGSTRSWSYSTTVNVGTQTQRHWFGGEAGVPGAPLSNPTISKTSCE